MKKLIFTLMMMAGLALIAGTAMALNDQQVYPGGEYSYKLNGITVNTEGTATINFEGDDDESFTVTSGSSFTPTTEVTTSGSGNASFTALAGSYDLEFNMELSSDAPTSATSNLVVTITDGDATDGCSNYINYAIEVLPLPTYELAITVDVTGFDACQTRAGDPASNDNAPDATVATDDESNSFTVTVTPTIDGIITGSDYTYDYTVSISDLTSALNSYDVTSSDVSITDLATLDGGEKYSSGSISTDPSTLTGDVFTITFNTTTGIAAQDIVSALTLGVGNSELTASGGIVEQATLEGTNPGTQTVTVGAVPSIGTFGN
jgi:hypothetical protein